ncbi:MAG: outer membrane lipoprotein-sorting protein [Verrucomicrobiae bacterium]|nr:outer membrane lipoprotein-sorting protein [Verrucomicrobiae bacterium]
MKTQRQAFWAALALAMIAQAGPRLSAAPDPNAPMPPAEMIIALLWKNMDLQAFTLTGQIRTPKAKHPIALKTRGREMIYEALGSPLQIRVRLDAAGSEVYTRASGGQDWKRVTGGAISDPVLGSDITYEELGLHFLSWPRVEPVGVDSIKTFKSYAFDAYPEGTASRYAKVRFWITHDHCLMIRADGYNKDDQIIKRVEVNGVAQIDNAWTIKQMMISTMIPGRELSKSRTYIDIMDGAAGLE